MILLRPRRTLFWQGITACAAFLTPVFAVLYVITVSSGGEWAGVLALQLLASGLIALASVRFFLVAIRVGPRGISERGYLFPKRHFPAESVDSIVRARTFGNGSDVIDQLFVLDADGNWIVRLRGQFWSREDMDTVIEALGAPVTVLADTMTLRELAAEHPKLVYWFERF